MAGPQADPRKVVNHCFTPIGVDRLPGIKREGGVRIWVTGCAGFIGSHLCDALRTQGHNVTGNDDLSGGDETNIPEDMNWLKGRCQDIQALPKTVDALIHCAALAHEGLSVFSPKHITDSIYSASVSVFSAAIAAGVKRIVYLSSMSRYGAIPAPFFEEQKPKPADPYAIAKVAAEDTLRVLCETHGVEFVICVPHSVYGPRQCRSDPYRNVVAIFMNRLLHGTQPIIYGDGAQTRCFSYIDDAIPSIVKLATESGFCGQVFNIGPDEQPVTMNELFTLCVDALGVKCPAPIYVPARPCEVADAWCSSLKARQMLGYKTETTLEHGLSKMAAWMKNVGPVPFNYCRPLEIVTDATPRTWVERSM
jgi:UDP-glucose 4-epimerase